MPWFGMLIFKIGITGVLLPYPVMVNEAGGLTKPA